MVTIMITSALHRAADWAKSVFSSAALGDPRRTTRLVNVAAQLAQQCQGRCGEVQAIATAATGLACFIFRFLRRPLEAIRPTDGVTLRQKLKHFIVL